ncbi:MAG TPA: alpha/beta hydrolase [Candidatus Binataceae bacterium]|nr:alpha/beta hydrolase [Candidatus Binataceae bacterium]
MPSSEFVTVNGIRLHYLDFGHPERPPLVCIHGLSGNAHNFDGLAPRLAASYRVISLDVRGRGDSEWGPPGDYNPAVYTQDLAALLDHVGLRRVTLIGTSMGGVVSMMFAGGYPDRVERLVLNDIGPEIDPAGQKRIVAYMTVSPQSFGAMTEVATYYRENYPPLRNVADDALLEFVKWSVRPDSNGRLVWKMDPAIRNIPRTGAAARPMDLWVYFNRIAAPVLVIRGSDSDILARATADRMRVVLPGTRIVEVPGVGHAPSLLENEALAAIMDFLKT